MIATFAIVSGVNLLTSFYQLDDEARKEVVETIQFKLQYHKDAERAEQVKQIKGW